MWGHFIALLFFLFFFFDTHYLQRPYLFVFWFIICVNDIVYKVDFGVSVKSWDQIVLKISYLRVFLSRIRGIARLILKQQSSSRLINEFISIQLFILKCDQVIVLFRSGSFSRWGNKTLIERWDEIVFADQTFLQLIYKNSHYLCHMKIKI